MLQGAGTYLGQMCHGHHQLDRGGGGGGGGGGGRYLVMCTLSYVLCCRELARILVRCAMDIIS